MKKILSMMILLAGVMTFTSCGDDAPTYTMPEQLALKSAETFFKAKGGVATVEVNSSEAITATTKADWLTASVSGSTVTLTATPNTELMGRTAYVSLTSASGLKTGVSVQQLGINLQVDDSPIYIQPDAAATYTYDVIEETPGVVDIQVSEDWLTADIVDDQLVLTVKENTDGLVRTADITLTAEPFSYTIPVTQFEYTGTYDLVYNNGQNQYYGYTVQLDEEAMTFEFDDDCIFKLPIEFDASTLKLSVGPCGSFVGMWNGYFIYLLYGNNNNYYTGFSNTTSVSTATFENVEDEDGQYAYAEFGGTFGTRNIETWLFYALAEQTFDQANSLGRLTRWYYPFMYKVTDEEATAAPRRSIGRKSYTKAPAALLMSNAAEQVQ